MKKLLLDAGHYKGYNQSKIYPLYTEGNKMWDLHLLVKSYLENNYLVKIDTTRTSISKDLKFYNRGLLARGYEGFYSFHSNACDNPKVDRVVIIRALGEPSLNSYCTQLGEGIKGIMGVRDKTQVVERANGNRGEYYGVLRGARDSGCKNRFIIEHSFHTNKAAAMWLNDDSNLKKLAKVEGDIMAKFHKLEKRGSDNDKGNDRVNGGTSGSNSGNNSSVKLIRIIKDVNYRWKADFSKDEYIKGIAKKGEVFTVVGRVKSNCEVDMYRLKSGYYITTSSKYVEVYK